jgi:hypothetical protein
MLFLPAMRHLKILLLLVSLALGGCAPGKVPAPATASAGGTAVSGKVSLRKDPVAGVRVAAWPVDAASLAGPPPYESLPTEADGLFRLELPEGEYYLLARGAGRFGYYGRNPVAVPQGGLADLNLALVAEGDKGTLPPVEIATGVAGRVLHDGVPLAGATVFAYTDLTSRLKGMGYAISGPSDETGAFELSLPPGTYYLLSRYRHGGGFGPLQAGDFIGYLPSNPLTVREGEVARVSIPSLEVPEKVEQMAATLFGQTAIQGRVLDREGRPVKGVQAVLYADGKMLDRPLFVSRPTGEDGTFILSFPYGGTYYLAARDTLGGAPSPGDLYGTYDGTPDHSLTLKTGEVLRGIEVVVEAMW